MSRRFVRIPASYPQASKGPRGNTRDPEGDSSLVKRAQQGDAQAFAELDKRYRDKFKAFLGKKDDLDPYETDDIAQAAFIKAHRFLPKFRGDCTFETLLLRHIGPSAVKDYFRSQGQARKSKIQAIDDIEERRRLDEDVLDNEGLTAKYEIEVPPTLGLIPYWMGRKSIRLRPLERKRWLEHKVDLAKTKKALAHLWLTRSTDRTQSEWRSVARMCADVLTVLHPGRGRYPHPAAMGRGYFILTAMDRYPKSEKGQALFLAGLLAKCLPAPRGGRRPKSGLTLETVLGVPSTKQPRSTSYSSAAQV